MDGQEAAVVKYSPVSGEIKKQEDSQTGEGVEECVMGAVHV
jgi:hypothetical protein